MFDSYSSKAIMAKARAMYGKRITNEQYEAMLKCHTVSETAAFLKTQTHFSSALLGIAENNIHRGQLENLLHRAEFENYSKLYRYLTDNHENLFHYIIMEQEIKEILRMVLLLKADNARSFIMDLPGYLINKANVDLMAVAKVTSFKELAVVLEHTDYGAILKEFQPTEQHPEINYVRCEHEFYQYYYDHLFSMINRRYSGREKTELLELINLRVELLNIDHIVRCRTYLNTPKADVVRSLYPYYYKLTSRHLDKMIDVADKESLREMMESSPYQRYFIEQDYPYIESYTTRIQYEFCRKKLHSSIHASVSFFAYYILSQIELSNVTNIIESIRYQVSEEETRKLLII